MKHLNVGDAIMVRTSYGNPRVQPATVAGFEAHNKNGLPGVFYTPKDQPNAELNWAYATQLIAPN